MSKLRIRTALMVLVGGIAVGGALYGTRAPLLPLPQTTSSKASLENRTHALTSPAHNERAASPSPKAVTSPEGRTLYGPKPDALGKRQARIPELEDALDIEDVDEVWAHDVTEKARASIPKEAELRELDVRCSQSFCRVKMVKPIDTRAGWPEIDQSLMHVAPGEAVFLTEREGALSTGYLYFASAESQLPLSNLTQDQEGT